ncbi:hypothetical protein HUJ04_008469 [Dendroctonus ponderosae]|nr:hypothetical protein HUJ04_008469 [Dendroctonus ponderosae]
MKKSKLECNYYVPLSRKIDILAKVLQIVIRCGIGPALHNEEYLSVWWAKSPMRSSCTVLCSGAVILLVLAVFFGLLGHCNNDNKTIIACGLFILGVLRAGVKSPSNTQ